MGVGIVLALMAVVTGLFFTHVYAQTAPAPEVKASDIVNPVNTAWTLVAAFLVFGMQVGFTMLEAGFCRSRETVNVLVECVVDTCLCGILFYAIGFAFMFSHGNGFIGYHWFFLQNAPATYETTGVAFLAVWIFQFAFADTCSTITSGAMIGRTGFVGDLLYSICVTGFIYPIIGHWAWGPDGWLANMGSAGQLLSHRSEWASTISPARRSFIPSAASSPWPAPSFSVRASAANSSATAALRCCLTTLTIAVSGGLILWFGWYGFNPGSTLSAMDFVGIGRVATNTTLAACAAGLTSIIYGYFMTKKWDAGFTTNGFLAGLVAITCPCYWVSPTGAVLLGGVAGVLVILGVDLLEWLRIDDPIGAVPVHGFCGIWGTLSLGLFASGQYGATGPIGPDNSAPLKGLFYGGGTQVLLAQAIGSACITAATFGVAMVVMLAVNATGLLRLPREAELYGMDLHEHGISAYPEYEISPFAAPSGLSVQAQAAAKANSFTPSKTMARIGLDTTT